MKNSLRFLALLIALSITAPGYAIDFCRLLGIGHGGSSCGSGCEPGCGCEASCGIEPSCGCGADGRQFAGQTWNCGVECGPRLNPCTGPDCCNSGCGCAEPACGVEPSCGCATGGCSGGARVGKDWFGCGLLKAVGTCLCGCSGCDSEFYWSEWHNDPPRCCDPCDRHGQWIGPTGGYRAPYAHPYGVDSAAANSYYVGQNNVGGDFHTNGKPINSRVVRKPSMSPTRTMHR